MARATAPSAAHATGSQAAPACLPPAQVPPQAKAQPAPGRPAPHGATRPASPLDGRLAPLAPAQDEGGPKQRGRRKGSRRSTSAGKQQDGVPSAAPPDTSGGGRAAPSLEASAGTRSSVTGGEAVASGGRVLGPGGSVAAAPRGTQPAAAGDVPNASQAPHASLTARTLQELSHDPERLSRCAPHGPCWLRTSLCLVDCSHACVVQSKSQADA
jgi:hypothetical protein